MTPTTQPSPLREEVKEPATRWRNHWRSFGVGVHRCMTCGVSMPLRAGEVYANHCKIYPSRDIAETDAAKIYKPHLREYLGAYPEGEQP